MPWACQAIPCHNESTTQSCTLDQHSTLTLTCSDYDSVPCLPNDTPDSPLWRGVHRPQWPRAAIIVGAREDQYVLPSSVQELAEHWAGSEVRWVSGGHVTAFVLQQPAFRQAICDSLARLP